MLELRPRFVRPRFGKHNVYTVAPLHTKHTWYTLYTLWTKLAMNTNNAHIVYDAYNVHSIVNCTQRMAVYNVYMNIHWLQCMQCIRH